MNWIKPAFAEDGSSCASPAKTSKICNISQTEMENTLQDGNLASNWLEKFKPKCTKDLVINVTKIKQLEQWLHKSMSFNTTYKFLLLTGPSGSGKTTTFHTICKGLDIRIIEWITPLDRLTSDFDSSTSFEYPVSVAQLFKDHLFRATRYNSCLVPNSSRHVLLVKDFPNVLLQRPSVLHDVLEALSGSIVFPAVFICNKHSCNDLFPLSIKEKYSIHTIAFNPVTEKSVFKVLKTIISCSSKLTIEEECVSDNVLSRLSYSCRGDLRNAIVSLYFMSVRPSMGLKRIKNVVKLEPVELASVDERTNFFHALGRVLYPKRIEPDRGVKFVHSAEAIVENFESEPVGFLSQLHEIYPSRMGDIEDLSRAAKRLATSDILRSRWQDRDVFNHYSLAVAVRGLMVTNRTPQKPKFEAFRKSHTSRMEVDNKAMELEGKTLFSDLGYNNDFNNLLDILPFAELLMPSLNGDQLDYVQRTCSFSE